MKICLVSPYDFPYKGGVSDHISHLDEQLRTMGHEVKILAPTSNEADDATQAKNFYPVSRHIIRLPANGSVARISLSFWLWSYVKEILAAEQFDVIHLHEPFMPTVPLAVLRHSRALNIATFHAFGEGSNSPYRYGKPVLDYFNGKLHGRIAVSKFARQYVNQYWPADYTIIPNGIEFARFSRPQPRVPLMDDGRLNVLFVGRFSEQRKGFRYLLKAMPLVKEYFPNVRLMVAGKGDREEFADELRELQPGDVEFVGFVSDEELPRYYQSADVFCAPSVGGESFGIVLLEAMAAGTPVVAGNIAGYGSVLQHGQQGYLVEPKSEEAIARALIRLLPDQEMRAKLGAAGKRHAERYSWDKIGRRIAQYYDETAQRVYGTSRAWVRA
jgi:phosphatidyl-myo-inositol alpha-mannosyltransferase